MEIKSTDAAAAAYAVAVQKKEQDQAKVEGAAEKKLIESAQARDVPDGATVSVFA